MMNTFTRMPTFPSARRPRRERRWAAFRSARSALKRALAAPGNARPRVAPGILAGLLLAMAGGVPGSAAAKDCTITVKLCSSAKYEIWLGVQNSGDIVRFFSGQAKWFRPGEQKTLTCTTADDGNSCGMVSGGIGGIPGWFGDYVSEYDRCGSHFGVDVNENKFIGRQPSC